MMDTNKNKGFYRSDRHRYIFGVCGGMAEYLQMDVFILRLLCILMFFLAGPVTLLIYLVFAIAMPAQPEEWRGDLEEVRFSEEKTSGERSNVLLGILLITLGIIFLFDQYLRWVNWRKLWPVVLIILGVYLLISKNESEGSVMNEKSVDSEKQSKQDETSD